MLTETGIELPRFSLIGRSKASFKKIESVEMVPFPKSLMLRMRYGPSVSSCASARWDFFRGAVVVKLKPRKLCQNHLFAPSNPEALVQKLKSRIETPTTATLYERRTIHWS